MLPITRCFALPVAVRVMPDSIERTLSQCARGEAPPELALMNLLVVATSEEEGERALATAIWDALEQREIGKAERLGAMQKLWDGARNIARAALD